MMMLSAVHIIFLAVSTNAYQGDLICGFDDCADYCSGQCGFRNNISHTGTDNLTVYRMTPYTVTDLTDHNTGDAAGDIGFLLSKYMKGSTCRPPYNTHECFLDDRTIVAAFDVEFDAQYGPYLRCNPNYIDGGKYVNISDWVCAYGYPGPDAWSLNRSIGCAAPCQRANVSVGKDPALHRWWEPRPNILTYFGGYWYDTPKLGACTGNQTPGDGSGCTWRIRAAPRYINATCLVGRIFDKLERANPTCFATCGSARNTTSPCYTRCVEKTILGDPPQTSGISKSLVITTWENAFLPGTGCPFLRVNKSTGAAEL
eukprot:m.279340 g.279340  ORF g.279340 m.279340 type:complete len:314 (+) comp19803_c0_seq1:208-1149(+)